MQSTNLTTNPAKSIILIGLSAFALTLTFIVSTVLITFYVITPLVSGSSSVSGGIPVIGGDLISTLLLGLVVALAAVFGLQRLLKKTLTQRSVRRASLIAGVAAVSPLILAPTLYFSLPIFRYGYDGLIYLLVGLAFISTCLVIIQVIIFNWSLVAKAALGISITVLTLVVVMILLATGFILVKRRQTRQNVEANHECKSYSYVVLPDKTLQRGVCDDSNGDQEQYFYEPRP